MNRVNMLIDMQLLVREKNRAIELRKKGFSYREILRTVHVSKSSLSAWLKDTPLSENERRLLKDRIHGNITRGRLKAAAALRANREQRDRILFSKMETLFKKHKHEYLFLIGIALYWAEGTHRSNFFAFTNSDPEMVSVLLDWIERYFQLERKEIKVRLYIHKPYAHEHCEEHWSKRIHVPIKNFKKTIFKPSGRLVKKRPEYKGCLRVELTNGLAHRKITFLIRLFLDDYRKSGKVHIMRP